MSSLWSYPCLPARDYSVQAGTEFMARGYEIATGDLHSGADINLILGGDSDLGKPVRSVGDGVVVHAGWDKWIGGIVIIHHPSAKVWSCYWHLKRDSIRVQLNERVSVAQIIGAIGKGGRDQFWAHLHFEIRLKPPSLLSPRAWASAMFRRKNIWGTVISYDRAGAIQFIRANYVDPVAFLEKNHAIRSLADLS